jgi:sporulation protein YlmC with PRC-barrel domain
MNARNGLSITALGAVCTIFLANPAWGEEMGESQRMQQQGMMQPMSKPVAYESSRLIGQDVINQQGEKLGKIRNLAIGSNGQVTYAVLGVGGIVGVGEKDIAVPFNQLQISSDQTRITLNVSKDKVTSEFSAFEDVRKGETK